jgi:dipeptidase E
MKLLLTSCGVTNATIARALAELVGKKLEGASLAFVPTAAHAEMGDKSWLIEDLVNLRRCSFATIDIADISCVDRDLWLPKLEQADVLYFGGGKRYHLMHWMARSGLTQLLPELLRTRVYVGMSAGSMITGRRLNLHFSHGLYVDDLDRTQEADGLGYVDFSFLPHLNNSYFPNVNEETIERTVAGMPETVYALDDNSALVVTDDAVKVAGEGECRVFEGR